MLRPMSDVSGEALVYFGFREKGEENVIFLSSSLSLLRLYHALSWALHLLGLNTVGPEVVLSKMY